MQKAWWRETTPVARRENALKVDNHFSIFLSDWHQSLSGRLYGRLDDLISEPTRAVGATVTEGTVILIGLPRKVR